MKKHSKCNRIFFIRNVPVFSSEAHQPKSIAAIESSEFIVVLVHVDGIPSDI